VNIPRGAFSEPSMFVMQQWPDDQAPAAARQLSGKSLDLPDDPVSDYVTVEMMGGKQESTFTIFLAVSEENDVHIIRYSAANGWNPQVLDTQVSNGMATTETDEDGIFVAGSLTN